MTATRNNGRMRTWIAGIAVGLAALTLGSAANKAYIDYRIKDALMDVAVRLASIERDVVWIRHTMER